MILRSSGIYSEEAVEKIARQRAANPGMGLAEAAVKFGGESVYPLYTFDGPIENRPKIGVEISDSGYDRTLPGLNEYYGGSEDMAEIARRAAAMPGGDFVVVNLEGADPTGENKSVEECVALVKTVCEAIDKPLAVEGCKNYEKDTQLFEKLADALQGKNVLFLSAHEENYKTIAASAVMAYGQKIGAESAVDINLAKQLNVLIGQMGIQAESTVMNVGAAAAGYGFEYVVSTMDRVRSAALAQNDKMLQMPIVTPVASEAWGVKEAVVSEDEAPAGWGPREERGIHMEISTAVACLAAGSNAVVLRHPQSVKTVAEFIGEMM